MFVGARIKHVKIQNHRIETLYTRDVARETRPTAYRPCGRQQYVVIHDLEFQYITVAFVGVSSGEVLSIPDARGFPIAYLLHRFNTPSQQLWLMPF